MQKLHSAILRIVIKIILIVILMMICNVAF